MDSTFSNYEKQLSNIKRTLSSGRGVGIFYIYQDPVLAWKFTKAREIEEGRKVTKETFIEKYFNSMLVVKDIKDEFDDLIRVHFVQKDINNQVSRIEFNVDRVDSYIKKKYDVESLDKLLKI